MTAAISLPRDAKSARSAGRSLKEENELPLDFDLSLDPEVAFPLNATAALTGALEKPEFAGGVGVYGKDETDSALRARIRQALAEAEPSAPAVTADQVELMDIYERQGEKAATKFADQMVRNDHRRERRLQRLHYEELARQHNIKIAARKLIEQQQRQAGAASATNAQVTTADAAADAGQGSRKQPVSATAVRASADAAPGSNTA